MPWDGGGTFTLLYDFSADRDAGSPDHFIQADKMDAELANIVAGLENCMTLTGETTPTANIAMGGYTFTGLANASGADEPVVGSQVAGGLLGFAGTFGGTADALTATITFAPGAYATGLQVRGVAASDNTSTTPTLKLNALAVKTITRGDGTALKAGDIKSGREYTFTYDGTNFRMQSPLVHSDRGWPLFVLSSVSSTSNAYAATVTSAQEWRALAAGQNFIFPCSDTNTGAATLAINGGTAYPIRWGDGSALAAAEIVATNYYIMHFEGTYFRLLRTPGAGAIDADATAAILAGDATAMATIGAALDADDIPFTPTGTIAASTVNDALVEIDSEKYAKTGGVVSGDVIVTAPAASSFMLTRAATGQDSVVGIQRDAGQTGYLGYYTGASTLRWSLLMNNTAESGSNAGSNFQMWAYSDAGATIGQVFGVTRSTRVWNFNVTPTAVGNTMWHAGNDGAGSGLDADTLDGVQYANIAQAVAFARITITASTPTLVEQKNIGSVTDYGVGSFGFNFASALSGTQVATGAVEYSTAGTHCWEISSQSTTAVNTYQTGGGTSFDFNAVTMVCFD